SKRYSKMLPRHWVVELKRDLYESWLILILGMLVHSNEWQMLPPPLYRPLYPAPPPSPDSCWANMFFGCGMLMVILQYRPLWANRCFHRVRLLLLVAEILMLLNVVEWVDQEMWRPALGIFSELLSTLGKRTPRKTPTGVAARFLSAMSLWLCEDAPKQCRLIASFALFFCALDSSVNEWRRSIDMLVLGSLPETLKRKCRGQHKDPPPETESPEVKISKRICRACLLEMD
ncbi:hypothetical protein KR009_006830, partial [Drosophila setifemur]